MPNFPNILGPLQAIFQHLSGGGAAQPPSPLGMAPPPGESSPQDYVGAAQHYLANSPLAPFAMNPNLIFQAQHENGTPTFFGAHPQATHALEGAMTSLAGMGDEVPRTPGQSIDMVARGLMAYPEAKRNLRVQQLMMPYEMASSMAGMNKTLAEAQSQRAFANLRNSLSQYTGTQASSRALAAFLSSKAYMNPDGSINQEAWTNGLQRISQLTNNSSLGMNLESGDMVMGMPGSQPPPPSTNPLSSKPIFSQTGLDTNAIVQGKADVATANITSRENIAKWANQSRANIEARRAQTAIDVAHIRANAISGRISAPVMHAYGDYQDSISRDNVMHENLTAGLKGDQQAMLSLLANHLGMTMGLAKGARINQAMINEAQHSAPWLQGMLARWDDRGYLQGVTLTPDQMQQMVGLADNRELQDSYKFDAIRQYAGAPPPPAGARGMGNTTPNSTSNSPTPNSPAVGSDADVQQWLARRKAQGQ